MPAASAAISVAMYLPSGARRRPFLPDQRLELAPIDACWAKRANTTRRLHLRR